MSAKTAAALIRFNAVGFGLFALVWALAAFAPFGEPARFLLDLLRWPIDGNPASLDQIDRWLSAIGGGVVLGFSVMTFLIVAPGVERGDQSIRNGAVAAILSWFVIDSAGSIASGVASNAVFNLAFLALYLAPLIMARMAGAASTAR